MSEAMGIAVRMVTRDSIFQSDAEYDDWALEVSRELYTRRVYRVLMYLISPCDVHGSRRDSRIGAEPGPSIVTHDRTQKSCSRVRKLARRRPAARRPRAPASSGKLQDY